MPLTVDLPRAQRNAVAELIVAALHDRAAHAALAALARVLDTTGPLVLDAEIAARLREHRFVADAHERDAPSPAIAPSLAIAPSSHMEVVLAPAFARVRAAAAARVAAACVAADAYWRHARVADEHETTASREYRRDAGRNDRRGAPDPDGQDGLAAALRRAIALFGAGLYFEVHEELEAVWRRADGAARIALQGLIQIVVALHHAERGNVAGARRLLAAGRAKVEPYAPRWEGVALDVLLADLRRWEHARLDEERVAAPPRLVLA